MRNTEKERALKASEYIFAAGRITDPKDFEEFKLEFSNELLERNETPQAIKRMTEYMKKIWY